MIERPGQLPDLVVAALLDLLIQITPGDHMHGVGRRRSRPEIRPGNHPRQDWRPRRRRVAARIILPLRRLAFGGVLWNGNGRPTLQGCGIPSTTTGTKTTRSSL